MRGSLYVLSMFEKNVDLQIFIVDHDNNYSSPMTEKSGSAAWNLSVDLENLLTINGGLIVELSAIMIH